MKKILILLLLIIQFSKISIAQNIEIQPTNWWVGMKHNKIQLLLKGGDIGFSKNDVKINYPGVIVSKVSRFENGKYLAVDVLITSNAKPGKVPIIFTREGKNQRLVYWELLPRRQGLGTQFAQGVNSSDFIYFLMPDRFSNGDVSNDKVAGMRDQSLNRDSIYLRHGGDFQGIINHLDYFKSLGVTALWLTPVLENDMPNRTEHGYAFTNHYTIEPRFGGTDGYKKLSIALHKRGMKLMQDAVYNHVGFYHWMVQDAPSKDWIHQWATFTQPNYKEQVFFDPYASAKDKKQMVDGWFTKEMPDVNQSNPFVANFLIQHAIWCVENFGVDGWRIDTYKYVDLDFMNKCNKALTDEYPKMTMVGENWTEGAANQAYFVDNKFNIPFKSNLTGAIDFELLFNGINPALMQAPNGINKLYQSMSMDFLYQHPSTNMIFLDNHDMSRFFTQVKEDIDKQKMALIWLLTTRGIPQLYYGTEVLMKGNSFPHDGNVRLDFPGGWDGDLKNAFTGKGLSAQEKSVQDLVKILGNFRKNCTAITTGKLMQYVPDNGLYVYFRYDAKQTIMCVMNTSDTEKNIDFANYTERTNGFTKAVDILTENTVNTTFTIPAKRMMVLALTK